MVYHMPTMLKSYGNLRQFSGQGNRVEGTCTLYVQFHVHTCNLHSYHVGVEKKNDTSKRNYFSSNRHNAPAEIIKSDFRLESLKRGVSGHGSCECEKKEVHKDNEYWNNRGIQEVRKCARVSSSSLEPEP